MWWWLVAALATAAAAPSAPAAPLTEDSPVTEAPKEGLVETLRRQLMQDNEDYLPSDSAGIPMRARLPDDDDYDEEQKGRPDQLARESGIGKEPQSPPARPEADQEEAEHPEPSEPRLERTETRSEEGQLRHLLKPQPVSVHNDEGKAAQLGAVPIKDNISIEKYDQEYEFKEEKRFLENAPVEDQDFEGEVEQHVEDARPNPYEIEMAKHFGDRAVDELAAPRAGFVPRARDPGAARAPSARPAAAATAHQPSRADINISKKDLLYYMDEEKFAKSNLSIGFNADVAIGYNDFARSLRPQARQEPEGDASRATKKYRVLTMRRGGGGGDGRRSGRGGGGGARRFIQEEGATGVAILNVDAGPLPEFRLPRERRQYMHSDRSDASADPPRAPPAP